MVKKNLSAVIVLMMLFTIFGFSGCSDNEHPVARIERLTGMTLTMEKEQEYYFYNRDFQGSFRLYAIFKLFDEPKQFLDEYLFVNADKPYAASDNSSRGYYSRMVPNEYYLSFENEHYFIRSNHLDDGGTAVSMYFPDIQRLLFIIEVL